VGTKEVGVCKAGASSGRMIHSLKERGGGKRMESSSPRGYDPGKKLEYRVKKDPDVIFQGKVRDATGRGTCW